MSATVPTQPQSLPPRQGLRRERTRGRRRKHRGRGLTAQQAAYLLGLLQGRTGRGAALAAGYSQKAADNVAHAVEGRRRGRFSMMRRFIQLLRADRPELIGTEEKGIWRPGRD